MINRLPETFVKSYTSLVHNGIYVMQSDFNSDDSQRFAKRKDKTYLFAVLYKLEERIFADEIKGLEKNMLG